MLQHYILMRTKNKMKDYEAESEEWWEVVKEYFTKELENNLVEHTTNERILMYNLEAYYKKIQISSMAIQQVQRYRATMNR